MKLLKSRSLDINDFENLNDCPEIKIEILKNKLLSTDYQAIKFAEGELSEAEFAKTRELRRDWRAQINLLESIINK